MVSQCFLNEEFSSRIRNRCRNNLEMDFFKVISYLNNGFKEIIVDDLGVKCVSILGSNVALMKNYLFNGLYKVE